MKKNKINRFEDVKYEMFNVREEMKLGGRGFGNYGLLYDMVVVVVVVIIRSFLPRVSFPSSQRRKEEEDGEMGWPKIN